MKILVVCRAIDSKMLVHGFRVAEFVHDQVESLRRRGIDIDYLLIEKGGITGYLDVIIELRKRAKNGYNLVHAHYGLAGFACLFQRKLPVVVTFHGSDISNTFLRQISKIVYLFAAHSIFVSDRLRTLLAPRRHFTVLTCGVNFKKIFSIDKQEASKKLSIESNRFLVAFSGDKDNPVKNFKLAQKALDKINFPHSLIEIKNLSREKVNLLLNASDVLLITSLNEGASQVAKEAAAVGCPIISTDVGNVAEIVENCQNSFIVGFDPAEIAEKLQMIYTSNSERKVNPNVYKYDIDLVASKLTEIYNFYAKN